MNLLSMLVKSLVVVIYICLAFILVDNTAGLFSEGYGTTTRTIGVIVAIFAPFMVIMGGEE